VQSQKTAVEATALFVAIVCHDFQRGLDSPFFINQLFVNMNFDLLTNYTCACSC